MNLSDIWSKAKEYALSFRDWANENPMKAVAVTAVVAVLMTSCVANANEPYSKGLPSETVVALGDKRVGKFCSAVSVGDNKFLTANHCLKEGSFVILEERNDKAQIVLEVWAPYTVVKTIKTSDQALIKTEVDLYIPSVNVCSGEPIEGDALSAIGFPLGSVKTRTTGEFVTLDSLQKFEPSFTEPFYRTTIPVIGGNSGGGLFKIEDSEFCLQGLTTAVMNTNYPISWFSTLKGIKELLKD